MPRAWLLTNATLPSWNGTIREELIEWLDGRPAVCLPGNHDWANLSEMLIHGGHSLAFNPDKTLININNKTFAGFREIPVIQREWNGEATEKELIDICEQVFKLNPEVLCTHAPPSKILDMEQDHRTGQLVTFGIPALTSKLFYTDHQISLHLFGHIHVSGGQKVVHGDTTFVNSATTVRLLELK